jgi:hypothetical protein
MGKKVRLKRRLRESESRTIAAPTLPYLEKKIRFSFRYCNIDIRKFCIRRLDDTEIKRLYSTLAHFEDMTWQQLRQLPREKGFSAEKKDSGNHKMLQKSFSGVGLTSFFHFRIDGTSNPFRVFGAQTDDMCCVLLLDREGRVNH